MPYLLLKFNALKSYGITMFDQLFWLLLFALIGFHYFSSEKLGRHWIALFSLAMFYSIAGWLGLGLLLYVAVISWLGITYFKRFA